jgi:type I restriction enzyme M protein
VITKDNFRLVLEQLGFIKHKDLYVKKFLEFDCELKADFAKEVLIYPENKGFVVNEKQTCNFKANENFVVFECVHRLLCQGYSPKHIELEPKWQVGHGASGGRADILVKDNDGKSLLIIECKTAGNEFNNAWKTTQSRPTQLFSYVQQTKSTKFIALYESDFADSQVASNYYLINITDNAEHLEKNPTLKSYKDATTVEEIYQAWRDTYSRDYTTFGLFENNKPYEIGLAKPNAKNLKNIASKDIQGKYHEFATILRQHNVSGRENAFDKLVNLFLCKITDEKENAEELKFYWRGRAYDTPFDFQDRLQQLYKKGMYEFLNEDITYIDNQAIDAIFTNYDLETIKNDIKEVVKKQKFFTNNDFAFIDVHNEKLFYQNFEVMLKIARMIQDVSLSGSEENQFLGDMFEGFLDQGVKQSEGQFFTPMPIVKFIINSLPKIQNPYVVDYACGAGHFLNDYISTNKDAQIVGIEKEYRLSKVAKVSSFMYGSNTQIVYADALAKNEKIKEGFYDALVANPPYSVKGFLETLADEDRKNFELIKTIDEKSFSANNAIECFFIERAKQLLKKDGVAGIIVPSSILNKGSKSNIYVATREVLLKHFNIIAIAEFGSGTFGKTGTNTVTLFLQRRCDVQNLAGAFEELVRKLFDCKSDANKDFKDKDMLQKYCEHIDIELDVYKSILCGTLDERLFEKDIFTEYKSEFEKLTETKKRKSMKSYQTLTVTDKVAREKQELAKYINFVEKEKFYYFCLAYKNSQDVIIVKAPSDNKESKKFLGYEWSSAKGNEGIKYLSSGFVSSEISEDEALDEEDKRILENLQGLKSINTPLYNPQNMDDESKINKIIADNFVGKKTAILKELEGFVSRARLVDMLDFSRVEFNKAISLTVSKKLEFESKYPLEKIEYLITGMINGSTPSKTENRYWNSNDIDWLTTPDFNDENILITKTAQFVSKKALEDGKVSLVPINSVLLTCTATIGKVGINKIELATNQQINALVCNDKILPEYLANFLKTQKTNLENLTSNAGVKHINQGMLKNFKISLPPLEIQEQIVKECEAVDGEVKKANEIISKTKKAIDKEISSISGEIVKLGDITQNLDSLRVPIASDMRKQGSYPYYGASGIVDYVDGWVVDDYVLLISEDGANLKTRNTPIAFTVEGKAWVNNHAHILKFEEKVTHKIVELYLNHIDLSDLITGQAQPKLSQANMNQIKIPLPPIKTQKEIVAKIEKLEADIAKAKQIIDGSKEQKEAILKKWLNP